jgi:hypothetical protein
MPDGKRASVRMQEEEATMKTYTIQSGRRSGEGPFTWGQLRAMHRAGDIALGDVLVSGDGIGRTAMELRLHWWIRPGLLWAWLAVTVLPFLIVVALVVLGG